jgi:hypothetical protein
MPADTQGVPVSKGKVWAGRIISAIPVLMLLVSAFMKFVKPAMVVEGFTHLGWPERYALALGIVEIGCVVVYLIPRTAVLGAILMTGFLGGAIATHLRIGEPIYFQILLGVMVWAGLYLRDARLRALIPLRS